MRWWRMLALPLGVAGFVNVGALAPLAEAKPARPLVKAAPRPADRLVAKVAKVVRPTVAPAAAPVRLVAEEAPVVDPAGGWGALPAGRSFGDGEAVGTWRVGFTGYGTVRAEDDGGLVLALRPKASSRADETHAALVHSGATYGDVDLRLRVKTVAQLRSGSTPNAWESTWVLWHYADNTHFYYLALKPNGWELGKEDPAYPGAQRFLATGADVRFPVGGWHDVHVRQTGSTSTIEVDGQVLTTFVDRERPYGSGRIGLYSEDAHVRFAGVVVAPA